MRTGTRLFQYALKYKKQIIVALIMLAISVSAELTGPFIAKRIINNHILGIESPWYETKSNTDSVLYSHHFYKRGDRFTSHEKKGKEIQILQIGRRYVLVNGGISFDGNRTLKNGVVLIKKGNMISKYHVKVLNAKELLAFYNPEIHHILLLIGIYFLLLIVASLFQYGQIYLLQTTANKIIQTMRENIFSHIQQLPIRYFDHLPAGKIVSRITNDTEAIRDLYVTVLATFFTSTIYITGIFIALTLLEVKLALICLILIPIIFMWLIVYRKFASKYNHKIRSLLSELNATINESIQGMSIIQAFGHQEKTKEEFEKLNYKHFNYQNKLLHLNSLTSHNFLGVLRNLSFAVLIYYFGHKSIHLDSMISLGVLYAFVDYLSRLFQPIQGIVNQFANLEQARVAAVRVFELLDEEGEEMDSKAMAPYQGHVIFDDVSFGYKEGEYILKNISFEAKPGETIALVGHTGSGKSSIMNLLFRFYTINKGKILIDGTDISKATRQSIRKHMGIVLQDAFLFSGTIASNINLNDSEITREKIEKALLDVGGKDLLDSLPNRFDEPVLEKGSTLSSGQRQLISFARALAYDPAILVLDEATANIDTETETIIQAALDVLKKGRTTFIIAHRLSTIKNADQILVLDHGRIVEIGTHEELMLKKGKYFQMYQLQTENKAVS
ncbi:MAG: ABC transporter ATP-binding protein [Bacillota bacterium]|nr:ABC transporter ATP-binding protein [Bacillota bacterium]